MTDKTVMLMCLANIILYSTMLSAITVTCLLFLETQVISLESSGGSRKFWWGGFEAQNLKNSDVFTKIESDFSAEIGNSNVFFAQIQVVSKK